MRIATGLALVQKFFSTPDRPVTLQEIRALPDADRASLVSDTIAGTKAERQADGSYEVPETVFA